MTMFSNWVRDPAAESIMDELSIPFEKGEISKTEINKRLSSQNQARQTALDEERVESIKFSVKKNQPLPMIVVRKMVNGEGVIVGGNHRFAATEEDVGLIPCYLAKCTDAEFETLCRVLNTVVGQGVTNKERVSFAIDAIERLGMSQSIAAELYQIPVKAVQNRLMAEKAARVLADMPKRQRDAMTQTHVIRLGRHNRQNINIVRAAAGFVATSGVSAASAEYRDLCTRAGNCKTEAESVRVFESAIPATSQKPVPRNKRKKFISALTAIGSLVKCKSFQDLEISDDEIAEIEKQCKNTTRFLNSLIKESGSR